MYHVVAQSFRKCWARNLITIYRPIWRPKNLVAMFTFLQLKPYLNLDRRRICCSVSDPTNSGRCVVRFPNFGKSILYPKTNKTKTNSPFNSILYYFYPSVCSSDTHKCIYLSTLIYLSISLFIYNIYVFFSL